MCVSRIRLLFIFVGFIVVGVRVFAGVFISIWWVGRLFVMLFVVRRSEKGYRVVLG